ncbi:ParB/RepB/Spo0J family partition protein [Halovulum marinum]|nr:ParB N-terminal domain-containing protein [Halovulum marinum]
MTHAITLIPLASIDDHALTRDRPEPDPGELRQLRHAIFTGGLRQPIEVFALAEGGSHAYGLLAGYRRITACRELLAEGRTGTDRIAAFVRTPRDAAEGYRAMIEENEIRARPTPWERAMIAVEAHCQNLFASIDEAVTGLCKDASPTRRSRIRAVARVIEHPGEVLHHGRALSLTRCLRIAARCAKGFAGVMYAAPQTLARRNAGREREALRPCVVAAEALLRDRPTPPSPTPAARAASPTSSPTWCCAANAALTGPA